MNEQPSEEELTSEQWNEIVGRAHAKSFLVWAQIVAGSPPSAATPEDPRPGSVYHRALGPHPAGATPFAYEITLYPMAFGDWRVCFGEQGVTGGILDSYYYNDFMKALRAAVTWTWNAPIMDGWHYNPNRRIWRKDGDPAQETNEEP